MYVLTSLWVALVLSPTGAGKANQLVVWSFRVPQSASGAVSFVVLSPGKTEGEAEQLQHFSNGDVSYEPGVTHSGRVHLLGM